MASKVRSEDEYGGKVNRAIVDTGVKMATGLLVGGVFSLVLLKRRTWPVAFGVGTGFGMGYSNAENDFQNKNAALLKRLQKVTPST
ncbi:MICOS complex subunit Mic10-like [Ostrea edulis]|uniref:MICOS complex subunit Mic10-like n=1 Tax=Ostrea edulis TaxID=37623 RepID=UPI0020957152|nr:MICOS complex subunit Mic10-like [Ostrea edulis]